MLNKVLRILIPAVIGGLVCLLFTYVDFFRGLELRAGDYLFLARTALHGSQPVDPRILIVGVDAGCDELVQKPFAFWEGEFGDLTQAMVKAGAAAVALDYTFDVRTDTLPETVQNVIMEGRIRLIQALAGGQVLLGDLPGSSPADPGAHSNLALMNTADPLHNLVVLTVIADGDGVHREIPLFVPTTDGGRRMSMAGRLAEMALGHELQGVVVEGNPAQPSLRVNYPGPHGVFPEIDLSRLLRRLQAGQPLPDFTGKLCLVAPWSPEAQDYRSAPFNQLSDHDTYGIEIHAAALNTLLSGRYLRLTPFPQVALLCCLGSVLFFNMAAGLRFKRSVIYGILGLLGYALAVEETFAWANLWLPVWPPLVAALCGYLAGYMERYFQVEKKRKHTRDMFRRMVAPEVVEQVLQNPDLMRPGGTNRRVTVLYTDINDFTPMCEKSTPQEVIEMLNRYFEAMVRIIRANGGMLKQFVGDEIMVIYGAPTSQDNDAARAVNTALEMLERLAEMEKPDPSGRGFYDIKVGIHTGDVVVGHVGSLEHMEYAAVGDDVNLGARIMATTKKLNVKVLVSDVTRREAAPLLPHVEWTSHGVQSFKGKTAQVEVFEIRRKGAEKESRR